jgi:subtilisin family serine protease
MKKKLVGFFIIFLLITVSFPIISSNSAKIVTYDDFQDYDFVPGELIVKFKEGIDFSNPLIEELNKKYQVSSIEKVFKNHKETILDNIYSLKFPIESDIFSIVADYSSKTFVKYAMPNYFLELLEIPNDESFDFQWGLHNTGQTIDYFTGTPDADIDAPEAWNIETGSPDITIAIIDSGIDYTHPDLADNIWVNEGEIPDNGIDDDNNGFIDDSIGWDFVGESPFSPKPDNDPLDSDGHGTHCAGIASGIGNNSVGISGVCWNCKIMPVKIVGGIIGIINPKGAAQGIAYAADNGADIISMSFGGRGHFPIIKDALDYAHEKDVVLVAGSGNIPFFRYIYPAAYENVIAVAATDYDDKLADFSTTGTWVDVAAPGVEIYSTMPTYPISVNKFFDDMNYDFCDGTSMACPFVSGLAGLLLSYNPDFSSDEIRSIIRSSCDWIKTNKNRPIGNGRINAHKALLLASGVTNPPDKPEIIGPKNGKVGVEYTYNTSAVTDPEGDDIYYLFDWGDGTYSDWLGPFFSGESGSAAHKWTIKGIFQIRVKARDSYGLESPWSDPLIVSMPKDKAVQNTLFLELLDCFSLLEKILLYLF